MEAFTLVLIIGLRTLVPIAILRWPFWAGLACIGADAFDTPIRDLLAPDLLDDHYHNFDKAFDLYYLSFEAWVAYHWEDRLARYTALVLFGLRVIAVVLFEITGVRQLFLLVGPNIFENFYLWVAGSRFLDAGYRIRSYRRLGLILLLVGAPKVLQEYVMHYREAQTWSFVKHEIFRWR